MSLDLSHCVADHVASAVASVNCNQARKASFRANSVLRVMFGGEGDESGINCNRTRGIPSDNRIRIRAVAIKEGKLLTTWIREVSVLILQVKTTCEVDTKLFRDGFTAFVKACCELS
ncbi:hypothetical protein AVEN_203450-1 [Araneus ventricosus]|uniref:Uncharacterized protein n=1 Tax=Araneus ventricosus TaxID=182803 RepID=A0A4Y2BJG3_ARAVE|nr:hypothetical protein AVEN_203450-1 [Araneus ventricosus]